MNNYQISVPVFIRYLNQLHKLLDKVAPLAEQQGLSEKTLLNSSLQKDMLPLGQQINVAASFAMRGCYPLAGKAVPELFYGIESLKAIQENLKKTIHALEAFTEEEFQEAAVTEVEFRGGEASEMLSAQEYAQIYALPNFFFHWSMAYALLRKHGFEIGKNDFDGLHEFAPGFSFVK